MGYLDIAKKPVGEDWHNADIKAALEKNGWSLRRLGASHGYHPDSLHRALDIPWLEGEHIIAFAIREKPETIWPSRYKTPREATNRGRPKVSSLNVIKPSADRNGKQAGGQ